MKESIGFLILLLIACQPKNENKVSIASKDSLIVSNEGSKNSIYLNESDIIENKNQFFIMNISGAEVYLKPDFSAKEIGKLAIGRQVSIEDTVKSEQPKKIGAGLELNGYFLKFNFNGNPAYVHSSDITHFKPDNTNIPDFMGKFISESSRNYNKKIGEELLEVFEVIKNYEPCLYLQVGMDACWERNFNYRDISFNEAYHELINKNYIKVESPKVEIFIPEYLKNEGNKFYFQGFDATTDLTLIENQNGTYTIYSFDCD